MARTLPGLARKWAGSLSDRQKTWLGYIRTKWSRERKKGTPVDDFNVSKDEVFENTKVGNLDSISDNDDWKDLVSKMRSLIMDAMDVMMTEPMDPNDDSSPTIYDDLKDNRGLTEDEIWSLLNERIIEDWEFFPLWANPDWDTFHDGHPPYYIYDFDSFMKIRERYRKSIKTGIKHEVEIQRRVKKAYPGLVASRTLPELKEPLDEIYRLPEGKTAAEKPRVKGVLDDDSEAVNPPEDVPPDEEEIVIPIPKRHIRRRKEKTSQ